MQGIPLTGHQSITGPTQRDKQPHALTSTPMENFDSLINQLHMSYDCERKPEYQRKTYTAKENPYSQGEHTERSKPSRRVEL